MIGCVSILIPPTGKNAGDLGKIQISLQVKYFPVEQKIDWFNPIIPEHKIYKDK
jgi:hypothetical protein